MISIINVEFSSANSTQQKARVTKKNNRKRGGGREDFERLVRSYQNTKYYTLEMPLYDP
jgi:hypothetical protein